jgi:hypothetical protein
MLRDYKVYLDGVAPVRQIAKGSHFHILKATTDVTLKFDEQTSFTRGQGQGGDLPNGFTEVWLSSAAPQWVTIALGDGRVRDNTSSINNPNITTTIENANVNTHLPVVTCAVGVATLIASADVNRKELRITIDGLQDGGLFLGGAGILANQGGFLDIGQTDYIPTQGALYAFNSNADAINVSVMSLERV